MPNRASHLPGDFGGELRTFGDEGVDRPRKNLAAPGERQCAPRRLRLPGSAECALDAGGRLERAFDVDAAVDGTYCF
jgi:hypothetical protein